MMSFGSQCGPGWFGILESLCQRLVALVPGTGLQIWAIKQDMGNLRFAYRGVASEEIKAAIIGAWFSYLRDNGTLPAEVITVCGVQVHP
jgi:hypothetical protein